MKQWSGCNTVQFVMPDMFRHARIAGRARNDIGKANSIGSRWGTALALCLGSQLAGAQGDPLQVRSWAAACANCHGTYGIAQPGNESLAGVPKDELLKKLLDFKAGRKPATIMHQLTKGYSDEQLEQLAAHFAALKK